VESIFHGVATAARNEGGRLHELQELAQLFADIVFYTSGKPDESDREEAPSASPICMNNSGCSADSAEPGKLINVCRCMDMYVCLSTRSTKKWRLSTIT
jgi:hypothetical protein